MAENDNNVKIIYQTVYDNNGAKEAQKDVEDTSKKVKDMGEKTATTAVKWAVLGQAIKKASGFIADSVRKSADYIETLNVLQVAFDGNTNSIRKFADTLSDTLNLDDATILDAASKFKMLSKSMGLANETGEKFAELMTKMTLDYASLFNYRDISKAQNVLQNATQGYGKSLKQRSGVSVLETTVQTTLDTLGVDAYVEDMNDAEKALARVISMEYQLMSSQGDLARTIEAPANQMRVMGEQLQMLARNIGNVFLPVVAKILPYLNAFLIVLNAIISALARLVGYKEDMFDTFEADDGAIEYFDGVGSAIDGVGKSADSTAKKLQGLRGFDKLNVIKTPTETGSGGAGGIGGGAGGINPNLLKAFNDMADKYKMRLDEIETKATKIATKILNWLGFVKKDGEWVFEKVKPGTILATIVTIAGLGIKIKQVYDFLKKIGLIKGTGIKIFTDFVKLFKNGTIAKNMGTFAKGFDAIAKALGMSTGGLALATAAFVAIGVAVVHAYTHIEEFKNKVDSAFSSVGTLGKTIIDKFLEIKKDIQPILGEIFYIIKQPFEQGWKNIETIFGIMYDGVVGTFSAIADTIGGVAEIITDIINLDFNEAFEDLKHLVHNLKEDWDTYWEKIGKRFEEWKEDLLKKIEEWKTKVKKYIDEIPQKLNELPEKAGKAIGEMIKKIKDKIDNTDWEALGKKVASFIIEGITKKIPEVGKTILLLPVYIAGAIAEISWNLWQIGYEIMSAIGKGMYNWISGGALKNTINGFVKGIKEGLGIASPSKVILAAKIGDFSMEAITIGMERQLGLVDEQAHNIVETLQSGMEKATTDAKIKTSVVPMIDNVALNSNIIAGLSNGSFVANQSQLSKDIANNSKGLNNATFIVQVGSKEVAKEVITDLQGMAKDNGKPITIGG